MRHNKEALIKKFGGEEAYLEWMRKIASKGGRRQVPKGFSFMPTEQLIKFGKVNGAKNRKV